MSKEKEPILNHTGECASMGDELKTKRGPNTRNQSQKSALSPENRSVQNLKSHKPEEWEINLIGDFLLSLNQQIINPLNDNDGEQNYWFAKKSDVRREFVNFTPSGFREHIKELNGTDNIGTILYRCGFLCHTPLGSPFYKLKSKDYIKRILENDTQQAIKKQTDNSSVGKSVDLEAVEMAIQKLSVKEKNGNRNPNKRWRNSKFPKNSQVNKRNEEPIINKSRTEVCNDANNKSTSQAAMQLNLDKATENGVRKSVDLETVDMAIQNLNHNKNNDKSNPIKKWRKSKFPKNSQANKRNKEPIITKNTSEASDDANNKPTTSHAAMQRNLDKATEQEKNHHSLDATELSKRSHIDMIFDELPKVPKILLAKTNKRDLPIAQVRPMKQEELNQQKINSEINSDEAKVSPKTLNSSEDESIKLQQQYEKECAKKLQQELEDAEYAKKLLQQIHEEEALQKQQHIQQNQIVMKEVPEAILISVGPEADAEPEPQSQPQLLPAPIQQTQAEILKNRLAQMEFEKLQLQKQYDAEYAKKLQQELEDVEYAKELQEQYEEEDLKQQQQQQAQQNQTIIQEISEEIPISVDPEPEPEAQLPPAPILQTQEEILRNRVAELRYEKEQYTAYIEKLRDENAEEHARYRAYKFNLDIPHNKEYEKYYKEQDKKFIQEEDKYDAYLIKHWFKMHKAEFAYNTYMDKKRIREAGNDEEACSIQ